MYVCTCIYLCIYIHTCVYILTHIHVHIYTHTCTDTYIHVYRGKEHDTFLEPSIIGQVCWKSMTHNFKDLTFADTAQHYNVLLYFCEYVCVGMRVWSPISQRTFAGKSAYVTSYQRVLLQKELHITGLCAISALFAERAPHHRAQKEPFLRIETYDDDCFYYFQQ